MINWEQKYAHRTERIKSSAIRELLKLTQQPDVISFAGGLPAPELFPIDLIKEACLSVLDHKAAVALQYGTTEGYTPLREVIAQDAYQFGTKIDLGNILITSGVQQALDLIGKVFINEGDKILVEAPTYLGALQAWNTYGADYVSIKNDDYGMTLDGLERILASGIKLIYVLPNFQNPKGSTLTLERREKIVDLAEKYGVVIFEDDPYGRLRFEGNHIPSLYAISLKKHANNTDEGNVIYASSFSKILSPGLRLAWITAPEKVIAKLIQAKQGSDLHTSTFNQVIAYEVLKIDFLREHITKIIEVYQERRDIMLETLCEHMPEGVNWTHPEGGLFIWITLPDEMDSQVVAYSAIEEKVAYVPGCVFYPNNQISNSMRLNFSYASGELINAGICRLAKVIRKLI